MSIPLFFFFVHFKYYHMKYLFTILIALFCSVSLPAKDRTEAQMRSIAKQYLGLSSNFSTRASDVTLSRLLSSSQTCVYGSKGAGFVVISKDDAFPAVLGFSDSDYPEDNLPCGLKWWMQEVDKSLEVRKTASDYYFPANIKVAAATNFIKSAWNQMAPYNNLCPTIDGSTAPTGCVATSMAQIMYYYKYPSAGKGTGSYTVYGKDKTASYALDINSSYAWSKMKDRYIRPVDTDNAVATLMRDAGAASKMQYSTNGSGTSDFWAAQGFCNNFSYDSLALKRYDRDFYSDQEWMDIVSTELTAQRPILYCGQDPVNGGHAFVLDGINEDGLVHVNWGWSGSGNGWYDINVLKPTSYGGGNLDDGEGYHESQSMVFGFKTQEKPDDTEENTSLWASTDYSFLVTDNVLYLNIADLYNMDFKYFDGIVEIALEDVNNPSNAKTAVVIDTQEDKQMVPAASGYSFTDSNNNSSSIDLSEDFPDIAPGTYKLTMRSKSATESQFQPVRVEGGTISYTLKVSAEGIKSIAKDDPTSTGIQYTQVVKDNSMTRIYDVNGRGYNSFCPASRGIYLVKKGNSVRKVCQ